jgi:7,8-dihydropterin-6-yl-methyl-4-(beta-D-ribofuranosyl)aminobenzene 5'-phosphate synthase
MNTNPVKAVDEYGSVDEVELTVLLDNYPNGTLENPWGLSILLETPDNTILFDTGLEPNALGNNSLDLGKDLSTVDYVVISHEHGDHTFGLEYIAEVNPGITVYVPSLIASMVKTEIENLGFNVIEVHETTVLSPGIAIIGELYGPPYEHALAINVANVGMVIIVGCSHPRVENHVGKAVDDLGEDPYLVIGGFHLMGVSQSTLAETTTALLDLGIDYIYPIHCCGDDIRDYVETNYPEHYGEGCVGTHLIIDQSLASAMGNPMNIILAFITLISLQAIHKLIKKYNKKRRN